MRQQRAMGAEKWWSSFFRDPAFRLAQEVEAYHAQWEFQRKRLRDGNERARFLVDLARDLAGPMYGHMIDHGAAMKAIRLGVP